MSIRTRLLFIVISAFLLIGIVGAVSLNHLQKLSEQSAIADATHSAESLSALITYEAYKAGGLNFLGKHNNPLSRVNQDVLQNMIDHVYARSHRNLKVVDKSSRIVADSGHSKIGSLVNTLPDHAISQLLQDGEPRAFVEYSPASQEEIRQIVVPVYGNGQQIIGATIFEYTSLYKETENLLRKSVWAVGLATLIALSLALISGILVANRLTNALRDLRRSALMIAAGKNTKHIAPASCREIQDLVRVFNRMTRKLTQGNADLKYEVSERTKAEAALIIINGELEQRVNQRTSELLVINEQMKGELEERARIEARLELLAQFDGLTGLPNRNLFQDRLAKSVLHARCHDCMSALMFIDLDRFKEINDSLGHAAGDIVLKEVGKRLLSVVRTVDTVARLSGDEFTVILDLVQYANDAAVVAEKILATLSRPINVDGREIFVTASIGIAVFPVGDGTHDDFLRYADIALYQAKANGRNTYHVFSTELSEGLTRRMEISEQLRRAVERNEFSLHYQPIVSVSTRKITGVEALLRWNNHLIGEVPPEEFIPIAEEIGIIEKIGEWVLATACRESKLWRESGHDPILLSVNLSPKQFRNLELAEIIAGIMKNTGFDPE